MRNAGAPDSFVRQGIRFAMAGGAVAVVYLGVTTVLSAVVGVPFQAALAIGFCLALGVHFTLQRAFVWSRDADFALPLHEQATRYLIAAGIQYGLTVASTSILPDALDLPVEIVYLATVAVILVVNFLVYRYGIFHSQQAADRTPREFPEGGL